MRSVEDIFTCEFAALQGVAIDLVVERIGVEKEPAIQAPTNSVRD